MSSGGKSEATGKTGIPPHRELLGVGAEGVASEPSNRAAAKAVSNAALKCATSNGSACGSMKASVSPASRRASRSFTSAKSGWLGSTMSAFMVPSLRKV